MAETIAGLHKRIRRARKACGLTQIELGVRLVCVALHNEYGFGAKRIQHLRDVIQNEYIEKEFNGGAAKFSTARKENVFHGISRLHEAYEAIFKKKGRRK